MASEYDDIDTTAIAAEIGESLFSTGADKPVSEVPSAGATEKPAADLSESVSDATTKPVAEVPAGDSAAPVVPDASAAVVPGENSVSLALPKSWKKEHAPLWEKADPALRAYVHEREAQVMRGINQYQQGYQAWDNLIKPFEPILQANPEVNPIQLMQGLMATHLQLLSPTVPAADKTAMAKNLLAQYGINLEPGDAPQVDTALIARLKAAEDKLSNWERTQRQQGIASFKTQVEEFASKNEHFNDVANDILRFIQSGAAPDIQAAYDLACWANPAVRAKLIAKQQSPNPPVAEKPRGKNGQFLNIEASPDVKPVKGKTGTMDDTINAVIAKAYTKH